ncbi:MAG: protein-export membrane protein SecD [Chloroflexi bacterium 13_1_40CM_4_68_4]|nr:MAG: protein-export membrane protein SecD [Chloroflexi bacterium 13_1_40CM_4_68_4]
MRGILPWLIGLIAILAVWVDIPKHQVSFPFDYPGISVNLGPIKYQQEIKTHLGLDLQGGTQLVVRLQTEKLQSNTASITDLNQQTRNVIDRRINQLGVSEPVIQALGEDKIIIELPGVSDLDKARQVATQQAFLEFKVPDGKGGFMSLTPPLTGANLAQTYVTTSCNTPPCVHFEFQGPDAQRWIDLSKTYKGQQVQISLDNNVISSPTINDVFTSGAGVIEGRFTTASARDLSLLLNSGALPVPLEVVQSARVDPTLGRDSVNRSILAGIVGLLLVGAFMVAYYRLPGVLAVFALLFYTALTYAIFRLVPVTLTLAGIAGFVLSIGMAVDANVLTFERLKEELRTGKSLRAAVDAGWRRAFSSIWYSNLATILTAGILFYFGTGTVKGFAFTLAIGVTVSFFTAVVVTQMLLHGAIEVDAFRRRPLYGVEERPTETARPTNTPARETA